MEAELAEVETSTDEELSEMEGKLKEAQGERERAVKALEEMRRKMEVVEGKTAGQKRELEVSASEASGATGLVTAVCSFLVDQSACLVAGSRTALT